MQENSSLKGASCSYENLEEMIWSDASLTNE